MPDFLTARQVAAMLGLDSAAAFYRRRARLEDDHAFPLPLPTSLRNMRWRRDLIEAWLAEQGRAKHLPSPSRPEGANIYLLEQARIA